MKKLYVLCFVALAAVFMDIVFLHSPAVSAQNSQQVRIQAVPRTLNGTLDGGVVTVTGTIVGFACAGGDYVSCYVAVGR